VTFVSVEHRRPAGRAEPELELGSLVTNANVTLTPAVRLTAKGKPRKRNPARGQPVVVRLQPYELALLDDWMVEQDDIPETRQDAIRAG
jgi:hypothetical protein